MRKVFLAISVLLSVCGSSSAQSRVVDDTPYLLNQALDMSTEFRDLSNTMFLRTIWNPSTQRRGKDW